MDLIDSHAHLHDRAFDKDRPMVVAQCALAKVGTITVGSDIRSSRAAVALASKHRAVWATVGVHPHNATTLSDRALQEFEALAGSEHVVAIGEIGLDYYRDLSPRDVQREAFRKQLALAARTDLPVVIHNRESTEDVLRILRRHASTHRGVIHSFLGGIELAETFLDLGFHLGIGGPVTFPKNRALRDAVRRIPLDRLLVETDCPYLTPVPYRGRRNEPAYVKYVAEEIAVLQGRDVTQIAGVTTRNAVSLFGLG